MIKGCKKSMPLVQRVKIQLGLDDATQESDKKFSDIRKTAKLVCGKYVDFKKPWKEQGPKQSSQAVTNCMAAMPEYLSSTCVLTVD